MKRALIIGGGFAGCAAAHQLAMLGGWDVTLVEAGPQLGAGVRTHFWGGHPYTFGPRHFLTQDEKLYNFLDKYVPMRRCGEHQFLTYVERDKQFYNYPLHVDDIARMPDREKVYEQLKAAKESGAAAKATNLEDFWLGSTGEIIYDKMVKTYTQKMWRVKNNKQIDTFHWSPKGVTIKEGPRAAWDTAISAYPLAINGYNDYFDIGTAEAKVLLNTTVEKYDIPNKTVWIKGEKHSYDIIVNSISLDVLFDYCYGELPFLGRDFHKIVLPIEHCFPENVYFLYYANTEQFTRIVEYKKFYRHESPTTLLGLEIPSLNGKHYPLPIKAEIEKHNRYKALLPDGVFSIGRAGSYDYLVDIDNCIEQAMAIGDALRG